MEKNSSNSFWKACFDTSTKESKIWNPRTVRIILQAVKFLDYFNF